MRIVNARTIALAAVAATALATTACGAATSGAKQTDEKVSVTSFKYMVPNAAGSGWDTTARTASKSLEDAKVVDRIDVFNVEGANGTVGLTRLIGEKGNGQLVMQMGLGLVAASVSQNSQATFDKTTPIAKLIDDYEVVVVPKGSRFKDLPSLVNEWKSNPGLKIGGGSAIGGADHLTPLLIAQASGIDTAKVNYVSFGGGGIMPAILGKQVDFGVTSAGDASELIKSGELTALAVSGPKRLDSLPEVPTLKEAGTEVEFANWRGVVAPPGITDAQKAALIDVFTKMHETAQWKSAVDKNGWTDAFMTGADFSTYLTDQREQVASALAGISK